MENIYHLMNKDNLLLTFYIDIDIFGQEIAKEIKINKDFEYLFCKDSKNYIYGWSNIDNWIDNRNYAKHKNHLKNMLNQWHINDKIGFINLTKCLSLNDTLWIKKESDNSNWKDVNLYSNEFSDVVEKISFEKGLKGIKLSTTDPEITSEGSFKKCWKRKNNKIVLLKGGSEGFFNSGLEPYSEYFASQISNIICSNSVKYNLINHKNNIVTECNAFTNEEIGFVPFYKVFNLNKNCYNLNTIINYFIGSKYENKFREMMVLDSIIINTDRHIGNFGFLINNNTFEIIDFSPIYDFNQSLLCYATQDDFDNIYDYMKDLNYGPKLGGDFILVAKNLKTNSISNNIRKIINFNLEYNNAGNFPEWRIKQLNDIIKKQCSNILL